MFFPSRAILPLLFLIALLVMPRPILAAVLTADTTWQGEVLLSDDLVVAPGVTLTIAPGTTVRVAEAESTKTDPEYLSTLVELTVRGTLRALGTEAAPIRFISDKTDGTWAGVQVDGGKAELSGVVIEAAESGLLLLRGSVQLKGCKIRKNRYGLVYQAASVNLSGAGNVISANDYGTVLGKGCSLPAGFAEVSGNGKKDTLTLQVRARDTGSEARRGPVAKGETRSYRDEAMPGETVWSGRVEVDGTVRVPEGGRLVILPGTLVEFAYRDTNGDRIGESGLLIQGTLVAKGTPQAPIVFRSKDGKGGMGGWDAVNIMNSSGAWNLFEHCRIEEAYRGLHFHFSRVAVTSSTFSDSYRGIQFQEATVLLRGNDFLGNNSAVQGRDSSVELSDNTVRGNYHGINLLRVRLKATGNRFVDNGRDGVRIREGSTVFEENLVAGNRFGLLVMDAFFGSFSRNSINGNGEIGFSLKKTDNLEIAGNFISGNGLNGMNLQESRGRISGNMIGDNGERGLAVLSFFGVLELNNLAGNGLWAMDLDGSSDVSAPRNFWGGDPAAVISDKGRDTAKGKVDYAEPAASPFLFRWPLREIAGPVSWRGEILVEETARVTSGGALRIAPDSRVLFGAGAGLEVKGRIEALGEPGHPVLFTSARQQEPGAWGEVLLEHADGSRFKNCVFEYATWGVHSHFTTLDLEKCLFRRNEGGMRFRSGPVTIRNCEFRQNDIGIRSFRGNARVTDSTITGNRVGVFVREKGGGLKLRHNRIFANSEYNLRVGDFNDEDVEASENWWGTAAPEKTIFDGRIEPGIGIVHLQPVLGAPCRQEVGR